MRIEAIVMVILCAPLFAQGLAQSAQPPAPKKGIFALVEKLSGNAPQASPKGKVPPPPPTIRTTTAQHGQRILKSAFGRSYVLTNFKDASEAQSTQFEATLDTKNGFQGYCFGMSAEAFVAEAQKRGERYRKAASEMFSGKDFLCTTTVEKQEINGVPVEVTYAFYQKLLARIVVKPHPSHPDLTAKELLAVYEAFATAYGPGSEKILLAKDWTPTPFDGCDELVQEDALQKMMSTMLAQGRAQGGFRPDQIGENLTFCGYFWSSPKVEVNFCTPTDINELSKPKTSAWEKNTGEKTFTVSLTSKTILGPYLNEKLATKPKGI